MVWRGKNGSWFHRTTSFWTKKTFYLKTSLHSKALAVVAYPVGVRNFVNSITLLMDRNIATATKHYQVFVFIVTIVANCALSIFLHNQATLVCRELSILDIRVLVNLLRLLELLEN